MIFNIEVNLHQDGFCEAFCPEMGVSASGRSIEEALNKMRNLLVYYTTTIEDAGIDTADRNQVIQHMRSVFKDKNFVLPARPKVN